MHKTPENQDGKTFGKSPTQSTYTQNLWKGIWQQRTTSRPQDLCNCSNTELTLSYRTGGFFLLMWWTLHALHEQKLCAGNFTVKRREKHMKRWAPPAPYSFSLKYDLIISASVPYSLFYKTEFRVLCKIYQREKKKASVSTTFFHSYKNPIAINCYTTSTWHSQPLRVWASSFLRYIITHKDTPQSVGLLSTSDQPVAETSTWQHTQHNRQTSMPPAGFQPAIPVGECAQTYGLDCSATRIGNCYTNSD